MKTVQDFFNSSHSHPFHIQRSNKIQELRKPVYSKKIKQRKPKISLLQNYQFTSMQNITNNKNTHQTNNKTQRLSQQNKARKSKSQLFLKRSKQYQQPKQQKNHLSNNLIIEKLDLKKEYQNQPQLKRNNFMKLFQRITTRISSSPLIKIPDDQQKPHSQSKKIRNKSHKNMPKKDQQENESSRTLKKNNFKENLKIIDIIKKQDIQSSLINQLSSIRKKRNSLNQIVSCQQKGQSLQLVPKNGLFFMNYIKQKQRRNQVEKQPHINFIKSATQVIKIQENNEMKQIMVNRENERNLLRQKLSIERYQKTNRLFNSMKIQPW